MGVIPIPSRSTELERGVFFGVIFLPFLPIFVLMGKQKRSPTMSELRGWKIGYWRRFWRALMLEKCPTRYARFKSVFVLKLRFGIFGPCFGINELKRILYERKTLKLCEDLIISS